MVAISQSGGGTVKPGTYWNLDNGQLVRLERAGELPGPSSHRFLKLPALLLLLLSPVLGLLFVMFLPVIGLALVVYLPLKAVAMRVFGAARDVETAALIPPQEEPEP